MCLRMTYKYLETEAVITVGQQFARQFAKLCVLPILISCRGMNLPLFQQMKHYSGVSSIICPQMAS